MVALVLLFGALFFNRAHTGWAQTEGNLDASVRKLAETFKGSAGVYAKNLKSGKTYTFQADESFATASVFKVPVMIELFRRIESGDLKLGERHRVPATGISRCYASGALKLFEDQPELTLYDLCRLMIIVSDDIATDTLMQFVSATSITNTMATLRFRHTRVSGTCTEMHYRMAGIESSFGSPENDQLMKQRELAGQWRLAGFADRSPAGNVTTPREMGGIFEKIHRREIVSPQACSQMIGILKQTSDRNMIPRYLPPDTAVAHKIGATWRAKVDAGIAYLPQGPLVISIFTYCEPEEKGARDLIAAIARCIAESAELNVPVAR
jgi:beta-lactamase class A